MTVPAGRMIPNLGANEARETVFDPQKGFYLHSLLFKTPRLGSPAFSQGKQRGKEPKSPWFCGRLQVSTKPNVTRVICVMRARKPALLGRRSPLTF